MTKIRRIAGLAVAAASVNLAFASSVQADSILCVRSYHQGEVVVWDTGHVCVDPTPVDPIVCPVIVPVFPPEGDIPGVWDCPPYGN